MKSTRLLYLAAASIGIAILATSLSRITAQQPAPNVSIAIDPDDLAGVVTGPNGPEAGVWVIAQTRELSTAYLKIVVTDDQGRFLVPDLPAANYNVWVRGYGLVDSPKTRARPGELLSLKAVPAPNPRAAAEIYPGNYWYAMLRVPGKDQFPGTGENGNGINPALHSQAEMLRFLKTDSCESCHQLGSKGTREIPAAFGAFDSSAKVWERRVQSGQAGRAMIAGINNLGRDRALAMFGEWTDRIKAGAIPPQAPPRPQGAERNVVITQWDWADPKAYLHDEIATDKRNPRVNAYGLVYGSPEASVDYLPTLDPVNHAAGRVPIPVRDPNTNFASPQSGFDASAYWGEEAIWESKANVHNPMFDQQGRVWFTSAIRPPANPAFCREGSSHPSAKLTPTTTASRHLAMFDPRTRKMTLIDTCFSTHHLQFAEDANNTLWTSSGGGGGVVGWLNTKMFDQTGDEQKSQGWTALILDTNGNGRRDEGYVGPNDPVDPAKDKRINAAFYGVTVSPADGSVWGTVLGFPGAIVRLAPGSNPPATALAEIYEVPWDEPKAAVNGFSPRGLDIDRNGVVWTVLASGHLASFDRRKCAAKLNGPEATGKHCPDGWKLYATPGPQFEGVTDNGSADSHYYDWVDQFDTLGLGRNTPIATGNSSDSLIALNPANGQFTILRVPYPTGFFAKGMDGRIDDPALGWKGKGLWSTWATRTPFHSETGKGTTSKVVHFQMRPNPLAK